MEQTWVINCPSPMHVSMQYLGGLKEGVNQNKNKAGYWKYINGQTGCPEVHEGKTDATER